MPAARSVQPARVSARPAVLAGCATLVEFVFAPPAIALAIGAYFNVQFPALDPRRIAIGAYLVCFMALNIVGMPIAATFELVVTLLAILELCVFMGVVAPGFSRANFVKGGWAGADAFSGGAARHGRRDPVRDLVLPRHRRRRDGGRGGQGPAAGRCRSPTSAAS